MDEMTMPTPTPTNATPDPRAWRVAIALGLESGLDWARWAAGLTAAPYCGACFGVGHPMLYTGADVNRLLGCLRPSKCVARPVSPVPAPWDADAYLADATRRQVEPGPLPSLGWTGPDVRWRVEPEGVSLAVDRLYASKLTGAQAWVVSGGATDEQLALLSRLATAVAHASPGQTTVTAAMAALASGPWSGAAGWVEAWRSHGLAFRGGPGGDTQCDREDRRPTGGRWYDLQPDV